MVGVSVKYNTWAFPLYEGIIVAVTEILPISACIISIHLAINNKWSEITDED
jgi:hypothetical protein